MTGEVTQLLQAIAGGDRAAMDALFATVYEELRRRAQAQLRGAGPQTLTPTALVHETYLKLVASESVDWRDRGHFYRVAARAMRQIAIDRARAGAAHKRGDGAARVELDSAFADAGDNGHALLELDAALGELSRQSPRLAEIVELRFFVGLSVEETAAALEVTDRTVKRGWRLARAFLYARMAEVRAGTWTGR